MDNRELINMAIKARENAYSPTHYKVGAALLTDTGKVYTGCNLGSDDGIYNICAERVAICKMLSEGEKHFTKIAVVGAMDGEELKYTSPCGVCRQLILEFGKDIEVVHGFIENGEMKELVMKASELLPGGYLMEE